MFHSEFNVNSGELKKMSKCINVNRLFLERAGPSKKAGDLRSPTDLDVVLSSFQEFVSQYK